MCFRFSISDLFAEAKESTRLAIPMIAAQVIYSLSAFLATVMVAHLGKVDLAANALVWSIFITVLLFFIGVLNAVSIMIAQSFGAKDHEGIGLAFRQGLILSILFTIPMMFIMWLSPIVLLWTGQSPDVIAVAKPFFYSLIWCMLPLNILVLLQQYFLGIGESRYVMWMTIIQTPIEVILYYVLIFGKYGMPRLGLSGVGYALLISYTLISLLFGSFLLFSKRYKPYNLFERWWLVNGKFLKELVRIGWPLGVVYCVEVAFFSAVAIMMGALSVTELSAYQIAYQFYMIALTAIFGWSSCATVRVGMEVGRQNRDKIKLASIVNNVLSILCMLGFTFVFFAIPRVLIGIDFDLKNPELQNIIARASTFMAFAGLLILSDSLRIVSLGALRGLKDTKFPLNASIVGFWGVGFTLAYLLAFKLHWSGVGVWTGMLIGLTVASVILLVRLYRIVDRIDLKKLVTKSELG